MPLYNDFYAYGPTPVFSPSHYSALVYLGSSGISSYSSRLGSFSPVSSWSPLPTAPRLLPPPVSRRPRRFAPPSLPTISEVSGSPILSSSPRLRSHYTAPRPIRIDTADIDVSSPRNRGPFERSSDGSGDRKGSPKERAGTIRRGRTVVRLHTRRLKDGPPALAAAAKTPGERLAEKHYIRDPSRDSPSRFKTKEEESKIHSRENSYKKEEIKSQEDERQDIFSGGDVGGSERGVIKAEPESIVAKDGDENEEIIKSDENKSNSSKAKDKRQQRKVCDELDENDEKVEDNTKPSAAKVLGVFDVESVVENALLIVDNSESENTTVVEGMGATSDKKDIRKPKLVVGEVSIEVNHTLRPKPAKRLRMQVEVVVEGDSATAGKGKKGLKASDNPPANSKTPFEIHSFPSSPAIDGIVESEKFAKSKSAGELPKLLKEEVLGKAGESPKLGMVEKVVRKGNDAGRRKFQDMSAPAQKKEAAQVTPEKETGVVGAGKGATAKGAEKGAESTCEEMMDHALNTLIGDIPAGIGSLSTAVPNETVAKNLPKIGVQDLKKITKLNVNKVSETQTYTALSKSSPESKVLDVLGSKLVIDSNAGKKTEKDKVLAKVSNNAKPTEAKNEEIKVNAVGINATTITKNLQKQPKLIKELDIKISPQTIEIRDTSNVAKVASTQLSSETAKLIKPTVEKIPEASGTPNTMNENNKTEAMRTANETKAITDSIPATKTKRTQVPISEKERNATEPIALIIDDEAYDPKKIRRTTSSDDGTPVKMIKILWPKKAPRAKIIEKPPGLLAKLLESEKMLLTDEPETKLNTRKISRIKECTPGKVPEESLVTSASNFTKADSKHDETKTKKGINSQETSNLNKKVASRVPLETPTKVETQSGNKLAQIALESGVKTDYKKESEMETAALKTKLQTPLTKISQELRKTGTPCKTDSKEVPDTAGFSKDGTGEISSGELTETKEATATRKIKVTTGEEKKAILGAKVERKAAAEPTTEEHTKKDAQIKDEKTKTQRKLSNRDSPKVEVKKDKKVSSTEDEKVDNSKFQGKESPKKIIPISKDKKEEVKTDKMKKEELIEEKPKKEETESSAVTIPLMEGDQNTEKDEEESEEESESEDDTETETEDEMERQLVEEAINRGSVVGKSAAPAKSLPRFRDYNVQDFLFLRVLGKGSFGKVFLAALRDTDRHYAIKCLKKQSVIEEEDVECTLIERKVLSLATAHPYLCHLFCTFQTDSHLFFVMEYLNGGDLMFHIQRTGRFEQDRARFYAAEIVSGLKFLHKKGIVYRDLKLDNLLLDYEGHVRIADFGMCKLQIFLDRTADTFCGTPDYIAPEIIKGYRYNQTVDWWSFGVLLYEMLVGQSPFTGCDEDELFWSICNENPLFPRFLSNESCDILSRLLNKDSDRRLGAQGCPAGDVCDQPFFRPIDWGRLERKEMEPPFKPALKHPLDLQYFETTFTCERAKLSPVDKQAISPADQLQFDGFSYTNPNATD